MGKLDWQRLSRTEQRFSLVYGTAENKTDFPGVILEQVDEFGEAVILIGTRSSESTNRAKSIKKHAIKGKCSKGVSVIMLSQGIDEFNQSSFDFSSMCKMTFLLAIKDKTNDKAINKFLGFSDKEGVKAARSLEKIQKGQAISNIKEFIKGKLFNIKQFHKSDM